MRVINSENYGLESMALPWERGWPGRFLQACKKGAKTPALCDDMGERGGHEAA